MSYIIFASPPQRGETHITIPYGKIFHAIILLHQINKILYRISGPSSFLLIITELVSSSVLELILISFFHLFRFSLSNYYAIITSYLFKISIIKFLEQLICVNSSWGYLVSRNYTSTDVFLDNMLFSNLLRVCFISLKASYHLYPQTCHLSINRITYVYYSAWWSWWSILHSSWLLIWTKYYLTSFSLSHISHLYVILDFFYKFFWEIILVFLLSNITSMIETGDLT